MALTRCLLSTGQWDLSDKGKKMQNRRKSVMQRIKSLLLRIASLGVLIFAAIIPFGLHTIDTGEVGFRTYWGKIDTSELLREGLHFVCPIGGKIVVYDTKNQVVKCSEEVYTKDIQQTKRLVVALSFALDADRVMENHRTTGPEYVEKLVTPAYLGAIKNVFGTYEAQDAIPNRVGVRNDIFNQLKPKLAKFGVLLTDVNIEDIEFSDVFEKAVEDKQVAMQNAIKAKNETARITEEARQRVIAAEAEAKAMEVRAKALERNRALVFYEAVQKWDGKLPVYLFGDAATPLVNLPQCPQQEN